MTTDIDKTIEEAWHQDALAAMLPFESWERLTGESGMAYTAFCAYRDYGPDRNIRRAAETALAENGGKAGANRGKAEKRYVMWRAWAAQFRWRERTRVGKAAIGHVRPLRRPLRRPFASFSLSTPLCA
jgi:hypothetical protein